MNTPTPRRIPLLVKALAVLMTAVVSGLGLLALITAHAPERSTRYGMAGPLDGADAQAFGLSMVCFGLIPLMFLARTARGALWIGIPAALLGLVAVFAGVYLFR